MTTQKPQLAAALIGDVVASRTIADRGALHGRLEALLAEINDAHAPLVPLRITVGDEYQGCFATVGQALAAALRLRLGGLPGFDQRHGIGWGEVAVLREEPRVEDGSAWWAARAAIEAVKADATRAALRSTRTAYRLAEEVAGPDPAAVNAALLARDHLIGAVASASRERSWGVLRGLLRGRTQREVAQELGITASAVSQRVRADGLGAVLASDALLAEVGADEVKGEEGAR